MFNLKILVDLASREHCRELTKRSLIQDHTKISGEFAPFVLRLFLSDNGF